MRRIMMTIAVIVLSLSPALVSASAPGSARYNDSFIFVEDGITFSVFPNGEFDFYVDNSPHISAGVNLGNVNISFNSGYNYDAYVQYDDYGAVIQVLNTPVFYDYYGRVSRIGSINVYYDVNRVVRIGGLHVYYDAYGAFSRFTGYINVYNRTYVYNPFHRYFARPMAQYCIINTRPYRRYYNPVRYSYYKPYRNNSRRVYARVGRTYHYKENNRRSIYANDRRVKRQDYTSYRRELASRSSRESGPTTVRQTSNNRRSYTTPNGNSANTRSTYRNTAASRSVSNTAARRSNSVQRPATSTQRNTRNNSVQRSTAPRQVKRSTAPRQVQRSTAPRQVQRSTAPRQVRRSTAPRQVRRSTAPRQVQKSARTTVKRQASTPRRASSSSVRSRR
ncbi:hypothetical protein [Sinomicrobium sp.]